MIRSRTLWGEEIIDSKTCFKCGIEKPITEFGVRSYGKQGNPREIRNDCKQCQKEQSKVVNELKKEYAHLKPSTDDKCPICQRTEREILNKTGREKTIWVCEHNHDTGDFRGWICDYCNTVLARADESIETLERAIKYLKGEL